MNIAVVLFNLGGPDSLDAVRPFLFNLFYDRAILNLPNPFRWMLTKLISTTRTNKAIEIYKQLGGGSPLNLNTKQQVQALEKSLIHSESGNFKVFMAMRYWKPFIDDVVLEVEQYHPDLIVLLPLYPQFSSATTASSLKRWFDCSKGRIERSKHQVVCCYPDHEKFIEAHAGLVKQSLSELKSEKRPYLLFSAHGLPQKVIDQGDPYQHHVEQTSKAVIEVLQKQGYDFDFEICYQSKVGPLKWLGPSIRECLIKVAKFQQPIVVVPISFVSEHSETLVELDIEYKKIADDLGVIEYTRVPALGVNELFIECMRDLVIEAVSCTQEKGCSKEKCKTKGCYRYA